jgi:hypothetical protein
LLFTCQTAHQHITTYYLHNTKHKLASSYWKDPIIFTSNWKTCVNPKSKFIANPSSASALPRQSFLHTPPVSWLTHSEFSLPRTEPSINRTLPYYTQSQIVLLELGITFPPHGIQQNIPAPKAFQRTIRQNRAGNPWNKRWLGLLITSVWYSTKSSGLQRNQRVNPHLLLTDQSPFCNAFIYPTLTIYYQELNQSAQLAQETMANSKQTDAAATLPANSEATPPNCYLRANIPMKHKSRKRDTLTWDKNHDSDPPTLTTQPNSCSHHSQHHLRKRCKLQLTVSNIYQRVNNTVESNHLVFSNSMNTFGNYYRSLGQSSLTQLSQPSTHPHNDG